VMNSRASKNSTKRASCKNQFSSWASNTKRSR
jgi:hypothetical protein